MRIATPMRRLAMAALVLAACQKPDPAWTVAPGSVPGDPTVAGTPASVGRLPSPPRIDGVLDDPAWAASGVLGPLVDPGGGAEAPADHPVAAWARLGWDDTHLYVGVVVRDKKAASPFQRSDVDPHIWGAASGVELMLQPGDPGDNRDYYELQVDIAGAVFDSHFDDYNAPITGTGPARTFGHQDWSGRVERAVSVTNGRLYAVELALPWSALTPARTAIPPHAGDVWRVNLYTFRDGQRQALAWSPLRGLGNFHRTSRFGRIRFE